MREPDESNTTFGASPWKVASIVPAESEVDESPQPPSWASRGGYLAPADAQGIESQDPPSWGSGDGYPRLTDSSSYES